MPIQIQRRLTRGYRKLQKVGRRVRSVRKRADARYNKRLGTSLRKASRRKKVGLPMVARGRRASVTRAKSKLRSAYRTGVARAGALRKTRGVSRAKYYGKTAVRATKRGVKRVGSRAYNSRLGVRARTAYARTSKRTRRYAGGGLALAGAGGGYAYSRRRRKKRTTRRRRR